MAFKLKPHVELLPHQVTGKDFLLDKGCSGLFDEPGVGKTLQALSAICEAGLKAVVICPPFLANTWMTEVANFTELVPGKDIDIVPYTMLGKRIESFEGYGFVVCDEAHYLKNLDAQRTRKFHSYMMKHRPKYFSWMTGTPIKNRIPEIYSFLLTLSRYPHVTPNITVKYRSHYAFCMRFTNVSERSFGGRSVMQFSGMKNVDELKEYLKPWTLRRKADEFLNLPQMQAQMITANYKDDPELAAAFAEFGPESGVKGGDIVAKKNSAIAKAHFTAEYVATQLEADMGPVLIFSDHREPVDMIERELSENWRVGSIKGGDNAEKRNELVKQFQAGQLDALVCTVGSSSTGLTLTRSNLVVFNDVPWVSADLVQARKRIHRISQDRECRCVYIVGSKVDDYIIKAIRAKEKVIKEVVDNA